MKKLNFALAVGVAFMSITAVRGAVPELSDVKLVQSGGIVTISYTLANAPAVVTADILTNALVAAEGVSIGAENFRNLRGDVNKLITEDGAHTITWNPYRSWPGHLIKDGSVRARLTAWEPSTPPPYMVVDLGGGERRYYALESALPGGLHENPEYKLTKVVMRRIKAAGKSVLMGSRTEIGRDNQEYVYTATFDADYYIGVFEVTRGQWAQFDPARSNGFNVESAVRPMANASYAQVRWNKVSEEWGNDGTVADWPNAPRENSFLGVLRTATGIDFDLPTVAQWEYAARGGYGEGYWGDGSPIVGSETDANLDKLGRYAKNGGLVSDDFAANKDVEMSEWTSANGTAVVGSYKPNGYGLYDMHGNVREWVLDWWYDDPSSFISAPPTTPQTTSRLCTTRGGAWCDNASGTRAASRSAKAGVPAAKDIYTGLRLAAPCIAK